ncbi:MAG: oligoendopeptidase F [candidate division Zixibacteria bacterium]
MSQSKVVEQKAIPQRTGIEEKHKWDLSVIFDSDETWEKSNQKAEELINKAKDFAGKLSESPEILFNCLELRTKLSLIVFDLFQYARLNKDLDGRQSKYQAMTERAAMLSSKAEASFSFIEPELLQIDKDKLEEMGQKFPRTDLYDFYIKEFNRSREHIRSGEVEELLARSAVISRGPQSIFSMFDSADIKYPEIEDENGNAVQLTKQRFAKFMESPDRRVRREANGKFFEPYKNNINTLGAMLASSVNADVFYARARKFDSSLHHALDVYNIPTSVYHSLLDSTQKYINGLHQYVSLRKKVLKLDAVYTYDLYCPLISELNIDVPYTTAIDEIREATKTLGNEYEQVLMGGFDSRWIDVYETEGKVGGAYNWANFNTHPFVLMNYNNTLSNQFTLAHEMGHALHSHLANQNQPYQKANYSIFVAEVASTINEGLLHHYLVQQTDDDNKKAFLTDRWLMGALGTYFQQVLYAHFELKIHEHVEGGQALSPDIMNGILKDLLLKYFGPDYTVDEFTKYKWSRVPHFYRAYYVYQYATSFAASQAILKRFLDGEEGIIDKYLNLLRSGGNDYPIEQLKKCGVDMTTSEPFEATLELFASRVKELENSYIS